EGMFGGVDGETGKGLRVPCGVSGTVYRRPFRNVVATARVLVPNLKRLALVGDPFERQAVRSNYKQEIPIETAEFELIDLMGLSMAELRRRVAVLPPDTAIIYTAINIDGAGVTHTPNHTLPPSPTLPHPPSIPPLTTT